MSIMLELEVKEYFEILFDDNHFKEFNTNLKSKDFLNFTDSKKYKDRLKESKKIHL